MAVPMTSTTLFLGDLSIFCQEKDLFMLFQPFGPIDAIEIKRSEKNKPCLAYGFIKFSHQQSAALAVEHVNGNLFLGRNIRVCWALDDPSEKSPWMKMLENKKAKHTAQIHVSFNSRNPAFPVSESSLRELFSNFGEIVDVTINKTSFNKDFGYQSGYGFIHFPMTPLGVQSAVQAVSAVNQKVFNHVAYDCSVSHGLKKHIYGPEAIRPTPNAFPTSTGFNRSMHSYESRNPFHRASRVPEPMDFRSTGNPFYGKGGDSGRVHSVSQYSDLGPYSVQSLSSASSENGDLSMGHAFSVSSSSLASKEPMGQEPTSREEDVMSFSRDYLPSYGLLFDRF